MKINKGDICKMSFSQKYKPTTQKSLFHKDIVSHIRKWIRTIEDYADSFKSVKHILFLYGPIGCSKTVTVECLFKGYNLIDIDSDIIRSSDKISEIISRIVSFRDVTLANIDKWNHKNRKDKSNILFIDNLELCDRGIENFIETIYEKSNINIPIVTVCNSSKYKELFSNYKNCTFLEFKKPSLLELTKLSNDICKSESIKLSNSQIKIIIEKSEYDIRQLLYLLEQWCVNNSDFEKFIDSIQVKHTDGDLSEKLEYLFNNKKVFDANYIYKIASTEPVLISNSIYQNYLNVPDDIELTPKSNLLLISNYCKIIDGISSSSIIYNDIYENQNWNLYNYFITESTTIPSFYIKKNTEVMYKDYFKNKSNVTDIELREWYNKTFQFSSFKDVSYNFANSYEEIKKIITQNIFSHVSNPKQYYLIHKQTECFTLVNILLVYIEHINNYFNENKRGKNTSKKEKLDLCKNISTGIYKSSLDNLVQIVYSYKLFEIDKDNFIVKRLEYTDEYIEDNLSKINLRIFKRLLNIFTISDRHKNFKSNVETSLQYRIFKLLISDHEKTTLTISNNINNIITEDLDKIWNLS